MATWKIGVVWQTAWQSRHQCHGPLCILPSLSVLKVFLPFICPACSFLPPFVPHSLLCNYMGVCRSGCWEPLLRTDSSLNLAALASDKLACSCQSFRFFKSEGCKSWEQVGLVQHSEKKKFYPLKNKNKTKPNKHKQKKRKQTTGTESPQPFPGIRSHPAGNLHKRVQRVPLVFRVVGLLVATSWVSLEDALCLSPPPATTATSSLAMNYTGASGQHLIRGGPILHSPFPFLFLLWGSCLEVSRQAGAARQLWRVLLGW